jgi:protein phosphatase 1L
VPASGATAAAAVAAVEADPTNEVEEEGEEFAAYCRRGKGRRRVEMEDRHVAEVALGGDPQVVISIENLSDSLFRCVYFSRVFEEKKEHN